MAGAALLLAVVPGLVLLYVFAGLSETILRGIGSFLLVMPFFLNTGIMIVVAAMVTHQLKARLATMSQRSCERAKRARRWIWILTSGWFGCVTALPHTLPPLATLW